jgi:hypothetical protein
MRHLTRVFGSAILAAGSLASVPAAAQQSELNFGTKEDERNIIASICGTQVQLTPAGCVCFAEHAMTDLDTNQRAYLILTVVQPPAAERLDIAKSQDSLKAIFQFIEGAQKTCANAPPPAATEPAPQ